MYRLRPDAVPYLVYALWVLTALLPRKHLADHDRAVRQDRDARGDIVYPVDAVAETSEPTSIWDYEPGGAAPWPAICRIVSMGDARGPWPAPLRCQHASELKVFG